jgi:hypothetical protein
LYVVARTVSPGLSAQGAVRSTMLNVFWLPRTMGIASTDPSSRGRTGDSPGAAVAAGNGATSGCMPIVFGLTPCAATASSASASAAEACTKQAKSTATMAATTRENRIICNRGPG